MLLCLVVSEGQCWIATIWIWSIRSTELHTCAHHTHNTREKKMQKYHIEIEIHADPASVRFTIHTVKWNAVAAAKMMLMWSCEKSGEISHLIYKFHDLLLLLHVCEFANQIGKIRGRARVSVHVVDVGCWDREKKKKEEKEWRENKIFSSKKKSSFLIDPKRRRAFLKIKTGE